MSSSSDFEDDYNDSYQGSTGFAELQGMQRFLRVSDHILGDGPLYDDFIDRFDGNELSWP
jgi:hypothetical protein